MQKSLFSTLSIVAVLGAVFATTNPVEALTGRYITLTSSNTSWEVTKGDNLTVNANIFPKTAKITSFSISVDGKLAKRCARETTCSYTIKTPSIGKHTISAKAEDSSNRQYYVNKDSSFTQTFTVKAKKVTPVPTPVKPTPTPAVVNLNPSVTVTPNQVTIKATDSLTVRGDVNNNNGIWGIEVRALPSWSNVAITNRCILGAHPKTGTCSMNTGSFVGHAGQSVKVWTIYWDAKTGYGYASPMKTITIAK